MKKILTSFLFVFSVFSLKAGVTATFTQREEVLLAKLQEIEQQLEALAVEKTAILKDNAAKKGKLSKVEKKLAKIEEKVEKKLDKLNDKFNDKFNVSINIEGKQSFVTAVWGVFKGIIKFSCYLFLIGVGIKVSMDVVKYVSYFIIWDAVFSPFNFLRLLLGGLLFRLV